MSEHETSATQKLDPDYAVVVMDGAYCNIKPDMSSLIFFQDQTAPAFDASNPDDLHLKERNRTLKFEVRLSTSNLVELVSKIASAWGIVRAMDDEYQKKGHEETRDVLYREGVWAQMGYNLKPPSFVRGPAMRTPDDIDAEMEGVSHIDYRMEVKVVRPEEQTNEESKKEDAEHQ